MQARLESDCVIDYVVCCQIHVSDGTKCQSVKTRWKGRAMSIHLSRSVCNIALVTLTVTNLNCSSWYTFPQRSITEESAAELRDKLVRFTTEEGIQSMT